MFNLKAYLDMRRKDVDQFLDRQMPSETTRPAIIHKAMRYSVLAGGKRFRPILCLTACEAVGGKANQALMPAAAIELLHTYTLIHDDLPAMDNDALRRGKPTCHIKFGEANAILAGDALLTLAFECLAQSQQAGQLILELARAAGSQGVIGGQVEDLAAEGKKPSRDLVEYIHLHKTADLIRAATRMGAIAGGASPKELNALSDYGENIGLAFQIADDVLNATSDEKTLGKAVGSDKKRGKLTYVAVYGVNQAKVRAEALVKKAIHALYKGGIRSEALEAIALYVILREK